MQFRAGEARVSVNIADMQALQREVSERFQRSEGFALATLNLDHLEKLRRDAGFAEAYARHDLVTADGNPITWCAALGGERLQLLPGSDLIVPLARLAADYGVAVALLGSSEASLAGAAEALCAQVPGLEIRQQIAPPMGFDPGGEAAREMLSGLTDVGLCFLALGAPKQELLAARGREIAPQVGFVSIGAGLDFLSGNQTRAPKWVRAIAMEWLWRMLSNPRRLAKRYLLSAAILPGHLWRSWRGRS